MIIIAFSNKTSKILPKLICRKYKHVAPIIPDGKGLVMYQFVRRGDVEKIEIQTRDLKILKSHGWDFIYIHGAKIPHDFNPNNAITCVDLSKRIIGLKKIYIQTPLALYKELMK